MRFIFDLILNIRPVIVAAIIDRTAIFFKIFIVSPNYIVYTLGGFFAIPVIKKITKRKIKMKKITLAIIADAAAITANPKIAAIMAITKKIAASVNICSPLFSPIYVPSAILIPRI